MSDDTNRYPPHARDKLNRYRNRGKYDYDFIHSVLDAARVMHVAFPADPNGDDPFPAVLPMIGCTGAWKPSLGPEEDHPTKGEPRDIYVHGYVSSRIMRLSSDANGYVSEGEGLPVTVSATLVDGLVLSLTPHSHSYNYRSAVVHGLANPVTDPAEKIWALRQVTNDVLQGRWEGTRTPPTPAEMKSTQILRVRIVGASGKHRQGQPHDDKHDTSDVNTVNKVWTGVVPVYEYLGAPVLADDEKKTAIPAYITKAVEQANAANKTSAYEGMVEPAKST